MKRYLLILLAALALCGCKKESEVTEQFIDVTPTTISGLWMVESYDNGKPLAEGSFVYVDFKRSDCSYTLYQNVGSMYTQTMRGNYFIENNAELGAVIRGNYGTEDYNYFDWSHRYIVEMTSSYMRWTAKDDSSNVTVYVRAQSLPEGI